MPLSTYQREEDPSLFSEDLIDEDLGGIKKFLHLIRQERRRGIILDPYFKTILAGTTTM